MESTYKVRWLINNTYQVIQIVINYSEGTTSELNTWEEFQVFQGSLSDCESYIRLNEGGYM